MGGDNEGWFPPDQGLVKAEGSGLRAPIWYPRFFRFSDFVLSVKLDIPTILLRREAWDSTGLEPSELISCVWEGVGLPTVLIQCSMSSTSINLVVLFSPVMDRFRGYEIQKLPFPFLRFRNFMGVSPIWVLIWDLPFHSIFFSGSMKITVLFYSPDALVWFDEYSSFEVVWEIFIGHALSWGFGDLLIDSEIGIRFVQLDQIRKFRYSVIWFSYMAWSVLLIGERFIWEVGSIDTLRRNWVRILIRNRVDGTKPEDNTEAAEYNEDLLLEDGEFNIDDVDNGEFLMGESTLDENVDSMVSELLGEGSDPNLSNPRDAWKIGEGTRADRFETGQRERDGGSLEATG